MCKELCRQVLTARTQQTFKNYPSNCFVCLLLKHTVKLIIIFSNLGFRTRCNFYEQSCGLHSKKTKNTWQKMICVFAVEMSSSIPGSKWVLENTWGCSKNQLPSQSVHEGVWYICWITPVGHPCIVCLYLCRSTQMLKQWQANWKHDLHLDGHGVSIVLRKLFAIWKFINLKVFDDWTSVTFLIWLILKTGWLP